MEEMKHKVRLTNLGKALLDNATNGEPIKLTHIAVGDGNGQITEPNPNQLALINECWRGEITGREFDTNNQSIIKTVIDSSVGDFFIREAGVFDEQGRLIYIANTPEEEKVSTNTGAVLDLELQLYIRYDNADRIDIVIPDSIEERIIERVEGLLENYSFITRITEDEIERICGETLQQGNIVVVGESISKEDLELLLDDDPSNDPVYNESEYGAISKEDILSILAD